MINNIRTQQKTNYENAKISDICYDEKTKTTENLIQETQILDPVLQKVKMWKKHKNKPHSVTMEIRGNKGLFANFRKFKSIIIDENSGIITTYILKDNNKEQITIHRNHIVPYYPKEKRIKIELQNYLLTNEIPTFSMTKKQRQPKT